MPAFSGACWCKVCRYPLDASRGAWFCDRQTWWFYERNRREPLKHCPSCGQALRDGTTTSGDPAKYRPPTQTRPVLVRGEE